MSEETPTTELSELDVLKQRADVLGVQYSNNIGVDTLRERVNAAVDGETTDDEDEEQDEEQDETGDEEEAEEEQPKEDREQTNPLDVDGTPDFSKIKNPAKRKMAIRAHQRKECLKLVRVRVSNLNPSKKDLPGEILTTGNKYIGTVRRYIPFGEQTDDGWHIEQCLIDLMKGRKFLQIRHIRDRRTGINKTETRYVREFAIEELEPLNREDLDRLARTQAAADNA